MRTTFSPLLALACCVPSAATLHAAEPWPFITRRADRLFEGDAEFRFVSVNVPDILQIITHYDFTGNQPDSRFRLPDDYELRDAVQTVRQMHGRVIRTFVLTCREQNHPACMFAVGGDAVVPNEEALLVLDRLLALCRAEGLRLIVPFVAYKSALRGDVNTYGPDFWTSGSPANLKFKKVLELIIGRTNTVTGTPYRDDPTILAWQTGNELEIGDREDRKAWLHDIAAFVKRLDARHLLIDGRNKPADLHGRYEAFIDDPNIDAVSYHTYVNLPQADTAVGTLRLLREMTRGKKPLLLTEIAMYTAPDKLRALLDEVLAGGTSGAAWWALRFHNRDGGFYKHSDAGSQFEDLNWPGFPETASYLSEIGREAELLSTLRDYGARIQGGRPAPEKAPGAPWLLPAPDTGHLSWRGAAGANHYEIQRATAAQGPWTTIEREYRDHLVCYAPLYCDRTAEPGTGYHYRIVAVGAGGRSAPSNSVGPIHSKFVWLVDDLFDLSQTSGEQKNIRIQKAYAHTGYQEDISLAVRADPGTDATLRYRIPGALRHFAVRVFEPQIAPRFFVRRGDAPRVEVNAGADTYAGGRRALFQGELPATTEADTLEIVLSAKAGGKQAVGRIEIAYAR